jgi:thioredoxin 1
MSLLEVNAEGFNEAIKSEAPVFVKYWADWCFPCKLMAPIVETLAAKNKGIAFISVDVDKEPSLAQEANIAGIPTVIMYQNGVELGRISGFTQEVALQVFINKHFKPEVKPE